MSNEIVPVSVSSLSPIDYQGQRVITFSMMDKVHGRPDGTARKRANDHKDKLVEGRHFIKISSSEFRTTFPGVIPDMATKDVALLTERGYLVLVKSFTDDLAWQVQEQLVDGYFRGKVEVPVPTQLSRMEILQLAFEAEKENSILRPKAAAFDAYDVGGTAEAGWQIVAGHHRVAACRALGWTEIDAIVIEDVSHLQSELIEIDENLCRAELTASQRTGLHQAPQADLGGVATCN